MPQFCCEMFTAAIRSRGQLTSVFNTQLRYFSKERASKACKPGTSILIDNNPCKVIKIVQGKRGKGGGFVKATVKSLTNGQTFDRTYSSDDMVDLAEISREHMTVSYSSFSMSFSILFLFINIIVLLER